MGLHQRGLVLLEESLALTRRQPDGQRAIRREKRKHMAVGGRVRQADALALDGRVGGDELVVEREAVGRDSSGSTLVRHTVSYYQVTSLSVAWRSSQW